MHRGYQLAGIYLARTQPLRQLNWIRHFLLHILVPFCYLFRLDIYRAVIHFLQILCIRYCNLLLYIVYIDTVYVFETFITLPIAPVDILFLALSLHTALVFMQPRLHSLTRAQAFFPVVSLTLFSIPSIPSFFDTLSSPKTHLKLKMPISPRLPLTDDDWTVFSPLEYFLHKEYMYFVKAPRLLH